MKLVKPNLPPRYDEVYAEGINWVNSLGNDTFVFKQNTVYRLRARAKVIPYNVHLSRSDEPAF